MTLGTISRHRTGLREGIRRSGALALLVVTGLVAAPVGAQSQGRGAAADARVGLKPGHEDAGQAAKNLELVAHLPKPAAFDDPTGQGSLNFANSDIAFKDRTLFLGNFHGFNFYDIEDPRRPRLRVSVQCPGGQGDLSVYGNLLFMSVEQTRGRLDCGTEGVPDPVSPERFRGVRIFDISDLDHPRQVAAVQTCRGSHTHTLVVDPKDTANIYIYGSGTSSVRAPEELAGCSDKDPTEDPDTSLFSIDVIQVPLAAPQNARIVNRPRIFADARTGAIAGLWAGGDHGPGSQNTRLTNQCHDITVFPGKGLAAGACSGNGILLDISDPVHPKRLDAAADSNFAYWHSATFNNDGTKIIFTDEWGGGTQPRCRDTDLPTWGADAVFDIVDGKTLKFGGYFKMPAPQTEFENCVAHNGSLIPVPGRDIMVQAWYQGGLSVFDFTDSAHPVEIAYFDRGPIDGGQLVTAGYWSTYWYNGYIYGSEIGRGLDVLRLLPSDQLSAHEIAAAESVRQDVFNPQQQPQVSWPATTDVAWSYLEQLTRANAIATARARDLSAALTAAGSGGAAAQAGRLRELADQLEADSARSTGQNTKRLHALAGTLRGLAGGL
ncbi:MAG: hypothetical protein R2752_17245 [Vicinamibacterales bacterium]